MNGRERILATVVRGGPYSGDRIALGEMGFEEGIRAQLAERLGVEGNDEVLKALGIDIKGVKPVYTGPAFSYKPQGQAGSFFGSSAKSYSDEVAERPLRDAETVEEVEAFPWPTADDYDYSALPGQADAWDGIALYCPGWMPTFSQICELFGMEAALVNLALKPALIQAAIERITTLVCGIAVRARQTLGDRLLVFKTADDVAGQRGLLFSGEMWRRLFKPGMARQFATAKELGLITMIHSCGAVREIIPDLIEIGCDILEPTQVHLPAMAPRELKREFGKDMTFFGAICTQKTLPYGTPEDVRREVHERIRVLGEGGGYICSPDHTVMDDVPVENVLALYDEAKRI